MEQDQKDILIAQLKADNFELKQKEREYDALNSQVYDLEHRLKILQEEKDRMDMDAHSREDVQYKKNANLQDDIARASAELADLQARIRDGSSQLGAHKGLADDRNGEIQKLKREVAEAEAENMRLRQLKVGAERDLDEINERKKVAEKELDSHLELSPKLKRSKELSEARMQDAELEAATLSRRLRELEMELDLVTKQHAQKEQDLDLARQSRRMGQDEAVSQQVKQKHLLDEKDSLTLKTRDLDQQLRLTNRKLDDMLTLADSKEKELRAARSGTTMAESRELQTREEVRKTKQENEVLQILLDKYRGDVSKERQLRDAEAARKLQLEDEKKRLSREAMLKDIEARSAKQELEKIRSTHTQLLDEKIQASQELDAIKQHADLLESQNASVLFGSG